MGHGDPILKFIHVLIAHYQLNLQVIILKLLNYQGFLHSTKIL